jgi:GNAT superfamily N-acetyltransferase
LPSFVGNGVRRFTIHTKKKLELAIDRVDSPQELPPWATLDAITAFFHEHMKPYEDRVEDIQHALGYAFSDQPGMGGFLLLGEIKQQIAAALLMLRTGMRGYVPEYILLFVGVHDHMRGLGLGRQIIERAVRECDGDVKLHVEYDNPAKRLYERIGFASSYAEMRLRHDSRSH